MVTGYSTRGCENRPFFSASALASTVATKLSTAMLSVVTSFWGGGGGGGSRAQAQQTSDADNQDDLSAAATQSQIITALPIFQNGAKKLDWRCVLQPARSVAGCKTRLESRIKQLDLISFMIAVSGQRTGSCTAARIRPGGPSAPHPQPLSMSVRETHCYDR